MSDVKTKDSPETIARRKINAELAIKKFRGISNLDFSKKDVAFREACAKVGIEPTSRQASKWRNKSGKAYNERSNGNL